MRRWWYPRWRIRKIHRQYGYWDQLLLEDLTPSVGECVRNMERLMNKEQWYIKRYFTPRRNNHGASRSSRPRQKDHE